MPEESTNPSPQQTSYAGRWVARVRGRIVAQGGTPQQALRASQFSRYKEKPEIVFMPVPFSLPPILDQIKKILPPEQEIYLVGGAVRDLISSRLSHDLDFALPSNGISLARKVANSLHADFMPLDDERDTGRVILSNEDGSRTFLDFAIYRGADLDADLRARDFTINAIAYNLHDDTLIDPTDGVNDIQAKIIRACLPTSFTDDPLRILRGVRQAAAFGYSIDKSTREWMKQAAEQITRISPERLRDEIFKILDGRRAEDAIRALEMLGVIKHIMPELVAMKGVKQSLPHVYDVWTHTLAVLENLDRINSALRLGSNPDESSDTFMALLSLLLGRFHEQMTAHFSHPLNVDRSQRSVLFFAALYHDVSKPDTRSVDESGRIRFFDHDLKGAEVAAERARSFNLSNDEVERIRAIVRHHMRIHFSATRLAAEGKTPSRKAIYHFFRDAGKAGIDLIFLSLADLRATYADDLTMDTWTAYLNIAHIFLENYWEKPDEIISPPRLVDGHELMTELDISPGPLVGQLLEAIRENQATGKIENRDQALAFARQEIARVCMQNIKK